MARIWPVYEGRRPTAGGPWANIPLQEAIELLELRPNDFISDPEAALRFGNETLDLTFAGFKHIVAEIERGEAKKANWKAGLYKSRIRPDEAFRRLIQQSFAIALGKDNVLRVEHAPTTDSQGREALKITVVIAPDALKRMPSGAVLDALVQLRRRLSDMRDDRTPIVEYATEAELLEDAGP